jgi:serine protease
MVAAGLVVLPARAPAATQTARATGDTGDSAASFIPNDPGNQGIAGGWQTLQWNFADTMAGVHAPEAWENLIRDKRPGAKGVVIAVLDTGVAYRDWGGFEKSPDFTQTTFVDPCDLVSGTIVKGKCTDTYPLDPNGHGTFVTSEIAEATNNGIGLTGLAYGAEIMPVRVLNDQALGDPTMIADGIRYAVTHGAQVINLSLAFGPETTAAQIGVLTSAISYAHAHGVVVVAAAGNDSADQIDFPAADPDVISVGSTTADGCLARYSDSGPKLDLVAPGGGQDAALPQSNCVPTRKLPFISQLAFAHRGDPDVFALNSTWSGTSMSAPEVSAAAALVIASGVLGSHPTPAAVLARLEQTATQPATGVIGAHNNTYGYGIVNAGAATSPLAQAAR